MSTQAYSLIATLYAAWQEHQIPAIYYHYILTILQKQSKPNQVILMSKQIQRLKNNTHPYHNIIDQIQARERALKQVIQNVHAIDQANQNNNYQAQFQSADYTVETQYQVLHSQYSQLQRRLSLNQSPKNKHKSVTHFVNHLRIYQKVTVQVISLIDKWERQLQDMGYKSEGVIQFLYHKQDYLQKINLDTIGVLKQYEHIFQRNPFLLIKKSHQQSELALVYQSAKCNSEQAKKMQECLHILSDHEAELLKNRLLGAFSQKGKIKLTKASSLKKLYMNYKQGSEYYEMNIPFKYPKMNSPSKKKAILTTDDTNNHSYLMINPHNTKDSINHCYKKHPIYIYDNPESNNHPLIKNSRQLHKSINNNKFGQKNSRGMHMESDQQLLPITIKRSNSQLVSHIHGKNALMLNSREVQSDLDKNYGKILNRNTMADNGRPFDKKLRMLDQLHNQNEYLPNSYMLRNSAKKQDLLFNQEAQLTESYIKPANQQLIREVRRIKIGNINPSKIKQEKSQQFSYNANQKISKTKKKQNSNQKQAKDIQKAIDKQIDYSQVQNEFDEFHFHYESNIDQLNVLAFVRDRIFLNQTNPYSRVKDGSGNKFKQEIDQISKKILQHRGQIVCIRIVAKGSFNTQKTQLLVGFAAVVLQEKGRRLKRTAEIVVFKKFLLVEKLESKLINKLVSNGYGIIIRNNQTLHDIDLAQPISYPLITVRYKMALHHLTKDQLKRSIKRVESLKHSRLLKYYYYSKNSIYHDYCAHRNSSCELTFPVEQLTKITIDGKSFYRGTVDKIKKRGTCYWVQMHLSSFDIFIGKSIEALCELAESSFGLDESQSEESQKQQNPIKNIERPKQYHYICFESAKLIHKYLDHSQNLLLSEFLTAGDDGAALNSISFRSNSLILRDCLIVNRPYYLAFVCKKHDQKGKALAILNFE